MARNETRFYFAYGSNMYSPRMRERVPSAGFVEIARLPGYCLAFRKRGRDGSAKCDLEPMESETVWGVVYQIDAGELDALDTAEGEGYRRDEIEVATAERFLDVLTYRARPDWLTGAAAFDWYRDLVAAGAREHDLPGIYAAAIEDLPADPDPDTRRAKGNRPSRG